MKKLSRLLTDITLSLCLVLFFALLGISSRKLKSLKTREIEEIRDGKLNIYYYPEKEHRYIMTVDAAKDGVDAMAKLLEYMPDLMLLDIEMPRMDGYEVATHVRNDSRLKHLPIIMITSRTGAKHRDKAMEIGVNKYLGKPYQEEELMKNINKIFEAEA